MINFLNGIGSRADDSPELALQKRFLVYLGTAMSFGGLLWGTLCLYFDLRLPALIPYGYVFITIINFSGFFFWRHFGVTRFVQVLISLFLPFLFQYSLGPFSSTGAMMLWALIALVGAFTFEDLKHTLYWILLYVVLTIALGYVDGQTMANLQAPPRIQTLFFVVNICVISSIVSGLSYYFLRSRSSILTDLAKAKRETDIVLSTVDEGLFIIFLRNGLYEVGTQQSAAVRSLFNVESLPLVDLPNALAAYLNPAKQEELKNYLKLLQSPSVRPGMIADLNPLELVHTSVGSPAQEKYFQFRFSAVEPGKQNQYLVRIKDVTEATLLQQQLAINEKKNEENTHMILSVLHIGPNLLEDFIEGVEIELAIIENILQSDKTAGEVLGRMEDLYRSVHSIKGNASLLDLKILASVAHDFEEKVIAIRGKESVEWSDFIPLALDVAKLQETLAGLKDLLMRLQNFKQDTAGMTDSAVAAIPQSIKTMVERLAPEYGKAIEVRFANYDATGIPNKFAYILRDIGVQMARNSVAHGIETQQERRAAGKNERGTLTLGLTLAGNAFVFIITDDGRSFNFERIRELAMARYGADAETASQWDNRKLIRFIFEPGFSTAETTTLTAGRGMGLDIVRQRIKKVGGELKINFGPGKFTEFAMKIPLETSFT